MKKLQFTLATLIIMFALQTNAQISVNVSLGSRPHWHNEYQYNDDVEYYFLPEIEAYYDVNAAVFIYNGPRGWVRTAYLPEYCRNYDMNRGYKVAINYRGSSPFVYFNHHKVKYHRDNCRNYREEYYSSRHDNRRNDYAEVSYRGRYNNDNNYGYYKNNGHGHHGNKHDNRDDD